jgi:hypothetical protein
VGALKLKHAQCVDDQQNTLAAANLYLNQLKDTYSSPLIQPPLPAILASSPENIEQANTQISKHLNALIGYLDAGAFLNPMIARKLIELNAAFTGTVREKLKPLSDEELAECTNPLITDPIRAMIATYFDKTKNIEINTSNVVVAPLQGDITKIKSYLQNELTNISAQSVDYSLLKSSTNFMENIAGVQSKAITALNNEFTRQTGQIGADIDIFVKNSLADIKKCHGDGVTALTAAAEADRIAAERASALREYLQVLNGIDGMISAPSSPGASKSETSTRLADLLRIFNAKMTEKTQQIGKQKSELTKLISDTEAKIAKLREFAKGPMEMCDEPTLAKNKPALEDVIERLGESLLQLRTIQTDIEPEMSRIELGANAIRGKIRAENVVSQLPDPILKVTNIQTIERDYTKLRAAFDAFVKRVTSVFTSSQANLALNTEAAATLAGEIDACIERRKTTANAMAGQATRLGVDITKKDAECKRRIAALCEIANTGEIHQVNESNPIKQGFVDRLAALKQSCADFTLRLQDIAPATIGALIDNISAYTTGLDDIDIGRNERSVQYDLAIKSMENLENKNNELDSILTELNNEYEPKLAQIKTDITGVIVAQEEAAAAADINVLDDLKTRAFSGVSFNAQTGDLILSFGNAQQPRNVGDGQSDDEEGADLSSIPEPGPSQKGRKPGAAAAPYSVVITPTSQFYKKLVLGGDPQHIWLREIELDDLKAEFGAKKVNIIEGVAAAAATTFPKIDPVDKLAIAKAAANNAVVVRSLLAGIAGTDGELLKKYDILVRLCDKGSAAGVINELLIDKKLIAPAPAPGVAGFGLGIGIRKLTNTGEIEITGINGSGGAAATRQIRVGDIISTVDGVSLSDSSEQQVNEKLAGSQGSECVLRLKRRSGASDEIITVKVRRIPPLPVKNDKISKASVEDILQKLGWIGGENKVWYNPDKDPRAGGNNLIGGLFSLFSYNNRELSTFLSATSCATNYVCMLNWIFLIALRLTNSEPKMYTPVNIQELLNNIYASVYGFVETEQVYQNYFTMSSNSIKVPYTQRINQNLPKNVFDDATLATMIRRIKGELQRNLDDSQPGSASSSRSTSPRVGGRLGDRIHKKKTRRINRKIDGGHHTIKKHSNRESERGEKWTRRRHHKLHAKMRSDHIKTLRSARVSDSV